MSTPAEAGASPDDWDSHWEQFGDLGRRNPANAYRYRLIRRHIRARPDGLRILDIGSGQGQQAIRLSQDFPGATVRGVEYSESGVERSRDAAKAAGVSIMFVQRDLLAPAEVPPQESHWATVAVCSEVLEHLDNPELFLRHALAYLAPGSHVVITVPGGPRTAFDRHIGHRRHFTKRTLRTVLASAGLTVESVESAGFPFFSLYKLMLWLRRDALVTDLSRPPSVTQTRLANAVMSFFAVTFRWNLDNFPGGWQLVATATVPLQ